MTHEAPINGMTAEGMAQLLKFIDIIKQLSDEDEKVLLSMAKFLREQQDKAKA